MIKYKDRAVTALWEAEHADTAEQANYYLAVAQVYATLALAEAQG